MDKFHYLKVSHAALERTLLKLGFTVSLYETHRLYENKQHKSLLMLPANIPMDQHVRPAHLSSARHAVVAFHVADEATLTKLLTEPETEVALPAQQAANGHAPQRNHAAKTPVPVSTVSAEA